MSRRRGEFEHRTSIFEGAFRAWSHLGGIDPEELETKSVSGLDPLDNPLVHDPRLATTRKETKNFSPEGTKLYPYEPLPRSGLKHSYIQAILSPWLGPDADQDAIQLGLTTLRTWWQHRRKGESGTAIAALSSDKMRGVVEGYTRHFFNLLYCLVVNDKEPPPRTLYNKMKELEKIRSKHKKKRAREEDDDKVKLLVYGSGMNNSPELESSLSPLERLHAAQRRQLTENGGLSSTGMIGVNDITAMPLVDIKGKCIPGKIDLPAIVDTVNHHSSRLAYRGQIPSQVRSDGSFVDDYGDPNTTPVVFVSYNGDIQIAMAVEGITCTHCVKIVETVLKGCSGNKSPIDGLLDAAADRFLCQVIIKIDKSSNAKRIAFEAARNLSMVGYTAKAKEMSIVNAGGDKKATMDLGALSTAFEVVATTDPQDVFDWNTPCSCPDNGILRDDCARHSQMNTRIFEAFNTREQQVKDYMAGCGKKYGMACTCGTDCRCTTCEEHCKSKTQQQQDLEPLQAYPTSGEQMLPPSDLPIDALFSGGASLSSDDFVARRRNSLASRNPSIISFGGVLKRMSLTSDATFGRAMSGLSALSIDWENMEDFDVNVDHSAHIKYDNTGKVPEDTDGIASHCNMMKGGACNCGPECVCEACPIHDTSSSSAQKQQAPNGIARPNLRKSMTGDSEKTFKV